jgi:hypothetical protein
MHTVDAKAMQKLQAELAQERALRMKAQSQIGGLRSLNTKLQNLVLRYRDAEKQKATQPGG